MPSGKVAKGHDPHSETNNLIGLERLPSAQTPYSTRLVGIGIANLHRFAFAYARFALCINDGYGSATNGFAKREGGWGAS